MKTIFDIAKYISENTSHNESIKYITSGYSREYRGYTLYFVELLVKNKSITFEYIICRDFYNIKSSIQYMLFRYFSIALLKTRAGCFKIKKLTPDNLNDIELISKNFNIVCMTPNRSSFELKVLVPTEERNISTYQFYIRHKISRLLCIDEDKIESRTIFNSSFIEFNIHLRSAII